MSTPLDSLVVAHSFVAMAGWEEQAHKGNVVSTVSDQTRFLIAMIIKPLLVGIGPWLFGLKVYMGRDSQKNHQNFTFVRRRGFEGFARSRRGFGPGGETKSRILRMKGDGACPCVKGIVDQSENVRRFMPSVRNSNSLSLINGRLSIGCSRLKTEWNSE